MGQYYNVAINYLGDKNEVKYSSRKVKNCDYIMAKLMEHSYFGNVLLDSVAKILHDYETKLAWIGDYAEGGEVEKITDGEASYIECWGGIDDNDDEIPSKADFEFENGLGFDYGGKFLVNKTKNEYISFDEYLEKAKGDYVANPISILTAIGNGRGGGDFSSEDSKVMEKVGSWAWDIITIDDVEPKNMKKLDVVFEETY